jgi:hypothetical protein
VLSLLSDAQLDYWDYQAQASYPIGRQDTVSVVAFGGYDLFRAPQSSVNSGAELSFHRVDLRWDRKLSGGSALRVAATFGSDRAAGASQESSVVTDRSVRVRGELSSRLGRRATLNAGIDGRMDRFGLEADRRNLDYPDYTRLFPARTDTVGGGYLALELEPASGIHIAPGLRADVYSSQGATAVGVDPRVSAELDVSRSASPVPVARRYRRLPGSNVLSTSVPVGFWLTNTESPGFRCASRDVSGPPGTLML